MQPLHPPTPPRHSHSSPRQPTCPQNRPHAADFFHTSPTTLQADPIAVDPSGVDSDHGATSTSAPDSPGSELSLESEEGASQTLEESYRPPEPRGRRQDPRATHHSQKRSWRQHRPTLISPHPSSNESSPSQPFPHRSSPSHPPRHHLEPLRLYPARPPKDRTRPRPQTRHRTQPEAKKIPQGQLAGARAKGSTGSTENNQGGSNGHKTGRTRSPGLSCKDTQWDKLCGTHRRLCGRNAAIQAPSWPTPPICALSRATEQ